MPNFAIHDERSVVNVILAESAEIAEQVTGLSAIETTGEPWIGWNLHGDTWRPPVPIDGAWEWDEATSTWVAVVEPAPAFEEEAAALVGQ